MPFVSKAQQRFLFAKHPGIAREFAAATPDIKALPEHSRHQKAARAALGRITRGKK